MLLFIARVHGRVHRCSARSRPRSCGSSGATAGQRVGGAFVIAIGVLMIGYALRRGPDRLYAERRRSSPSVDRAAWGRCRSAWRSRRGGRRASARCSARSSLSPRREAPARGVPARSCYSLGLGVPFLLVGLGVTSFMGAFGWVKRHYAWIAGVSGALLVAIGVLLATGAVHAARRPARRALQRSACIWPPGGHALGSASADPDSIDAPQRRRAPPFRRPRSWRTLRSMRTALILLLLLALASVAGSIVPQWPNSPERVAGYLVDHPFWGDALLPGRLLRRVRVVVVRADHGAAVRLAGRVPAAALARPPARDPAAADPGARDRRVPALRRAAGRRSRPSDGVAPRVARCAGGGSGWPATRRGPRSRPRRASLREVGSLVFHWAFVLLLVGVIFGKGTGFSGRAVIVEGETWIDALANYDGKLRAGRFFDGDYTGIGLHLATSRRVRRDRHADGLRLSEVDVLVPDGTRARRRGDPGEPPRAVRGAADLPVRVRVGAGRRGRQDGDVVSSAPCDPVRRTRRPKASSQLAMPWLGFVKLPGAATGSRSRDRARAVARRSGVRGAVERADAEPQRCSWRTIRHPVHGLAGRAHRPAPRAWTRPCRGGRRRDRRRRPHGGPAPTVADRLAGGRRRGPVLTMAFPDLRQYTRAPGQRATRRCPWCWPRLSSSSWGCCPRSTPRVARSGCAPSPTATARCCR